MKIIHELLPEYESFPNHPNWPLLIYKEGLEDPSPKAIEKLLIQNGWKNVWINGIFSYHHYHSNTHEVLCIAAGYAQVQIGGEGAPVFDLDKGDVVILPAGTSHKNINSSKDFVCLGAYPTDTPYDMNYGREEKKTNILNVPLPKTDPIFGKEGPLFKYWK